MTPVLIIAIPMVFVWVVVLLDVVMRPDLSVSWKCACVLAVTLVWPTMIVLLASLSPAHDTPVNA